MTGYITSQNQTLLVIDDGTALCSPIVIGSIQHDFPIHAYHDRYGLSNLVTEMREEIKVKSPAQMKRKLPNKDGYKARKEYWR